MHKYNLIIDDIKSLSKNIKEHYNSTWLSSINISMSIYNEYPMYVQMIKDMLAMKEINGTRAFSNEECKIIIDFCSVI